MDIAEPRMSIGFIPSNDNFPHEPSELAALRHAYLALFKDVHRYALVLEVLDPHSRSAEQEFAHVVLALSAAEPGHDRRLRHGLSTSRARLAP
jgi:hypothetical protein